MLKIYTQNGKEIDIRPEQDIVIEMESPILQNQYIPTAFSTSIIIPPTERNNEIFGYLPALKMEPSVKTVNVYITLAGISVKTGRLEYEGIRQTGDLEYNFTERMSSFERKIYDIGFGGYFVPGPKIVKSNATGKTAFGQVDPEIKYYNEGEDIESNAINTVSIKTAIAACGITSEEIPSALVMLGTGTTIHTRSSFNSETLPDITALDLIKYTASLLCMAVFIDGNRPIIKFLKNIFNSSEYLNWEDKVSDEFEASFEPARGYKFGYANSSEDKKLDIDANAQLETANSMEEMINTLVNGAGYRSFRVAGEDAYSIRKFPMASPHSGVQDILADVIDHYNRPVEMAGDEIFDNSTGFSLVKCVPIVDFTTLSSQEIEIYQISPIIDARVADAKRPTDVFIGEMKNGQITDKNIAGSQITRPYPGPSFQHFSDSHHWGPEKVFERYHQEYASFITKRKQTITADVNLSVQELASFRLWQKVRFASCDWFVKRLIVNLSASRGITSCRAEFVEV